MTTLGSTFVKRKGHECVCKHCREDFIGYDVKASTCPDCRMKVPVGCFCGCGAILWVQRWTLLVGKRSYSPGHGTRGLTYDQIYGSAKPACGFRPGSDNIAKRPDVRRKLSRAITGRYCAAEGKSPDERVKVINAFLKRITNSAYRREGRFRSSYEKEVALFFQKNRIKFQYEPTLKYSEGTSFFPDFVVSGVILEVSGFAYPAWQQSVVKKMRRIKESGYRRLALIVDEDHFELAKRKLRKLRVRVFRLSKLNRLVRYLKVKEQTNGRNSRTPFP